MLNIFLKKVGTKMENFRREMEMLKYYILDNIIFETNIY